MDDRPFTRLADVYDAIMAEVEYDDWVDFVLREATRRGFRGGRLLDLGCGTGNATLPAHARGFAVEGLDASPAMIEVARRKLPDATFHVGDFRRFATGRRYALVYSVFDALNNLLSERDFLAMLARVRAHVLPGGTLAFDCNTRTGLRELWDGGEVEGWAGEVYYRWVHAYDEARELASVEAYCRTPEGAFTEVHYERPYDPPELRRMLGAAGFTDVEVLRYPDGLEADEAEPRVWVFARRPAGRLARWWHGT